jgi:hypothetical protein
MRRPWFQFHLSTAMILMFVAAGLLWANMRVRVRSVVLPDTQWFGGKAERGPFTGFRGHRFCRFGWPCDIRETWMYRKDIVVYDWLKMTAQQLAEYRALPEADVWKLDVFLKHAPSLADRIAWPDGAPPAQITDGGRWNYSGLILNAFIALAILLVTASVLEWRIRRQDAARHSDAEPQKTDA